MDKVLTLDQIKEMPIEQLVELYNQGYSLAEDRQRELTISRNMLNINEDIGNINTMQPTTATKLILTVAIGVVFFALLKSM